MSAAQESLNPTTDDFASMLEASLEANPMTEGSVVKGLVTGIEKDVVLVDVGLKTEGRVPMREFYTPGNDEAVKIGDTVDIYLERIENALGDAILSRDKARREETWIKMAKVYESEQPVTGAIVGRVKGGFTVAVVDCDVTKVHVAFEVQCDGTGCLVFACVIKGDAVHDDLGC
mgnify:CR=1 FL=1